MTYSTWIIQDERYSCEIMWNRHGCFVRQNAMSALLLLIIFFTVMITMWLLNNFLSITWLRMCTRWIIFAWMLSEQFMTAALNVSFADPSSIMFPSSQREGEVLARSPAITSIIVILITVCSFIVCSSESCSMSLPPLQVIHSTIKQWCLILDFH